MSTSGATPVGAIVRGALAGVGGTVAMDLLLFARYKRGGGSDALPTWEFSAEIDTWDQAPPPAQVGRRLVEGLFQRPLPDRRAALVNNITHWGYGTFAGVQYGILAASLRRARVAYGLPFGAGVWATSYVVLPAAGLYKPIWKYDRATLAKDLSAHLLFGLTTAAAFGLTGRRVPGR
jgi:Protein of unknown function (DUF1440)